MHSRAERAIRGSLLGTASVILAAAAHAAGGGDVPGWLAVLVGVVAASLAGTLLVGRTPSLLRTAAVVGIGQGSFHLLFAGLGSPGVVLPAGHEHGAVLVGSAHLAAHAGHSMGAGMLVAHAAAAAVTLALVRGAEARLWRMLQTAIRHLLAPAPDPLDLAFPLPRPLSGTTPTLLRGSHPPPLRRGPPALSLV